VVRCEGEARLGLGIWLRRVRDRVVDQPERRAADGTETRQQPHLVGARVRG
jgi:hypothetical protein